MNEKIITFEYSGKSYKIEVSRISGKNIRTEYHINVTNNNPHSYIFEVGKNGKLEWKGSEEGQFLLTIAKKIREVFPEKDDL